MKNKTLLPITLVLLLGITACGGQPKKSSQDVPSSGAARGGFACDGLAGCVGRADVRPLRGVQRP